MLISLQLLFLRGHFVILDSFCARGGEEILGYTCVRYVGTLKYCDEFLMRNDDGLPMRVAQLLGTLKIDPLLNIFNVNGEFRGGGGMRFHLLVVGPN